MILFLIGKSLLGFCSSPSDHHTTLIISFLRLHICQRFFFSDPTTFSDSIVIAKELEDLKIFNMRNDVKFRMWDIGRDCEAYWYFSQGLTAPSPAVFQEYGFPLYSKNECSSLWAENKPW